MSEPLDLKAIQAACDAATPGRWLFGSTFHSHESPPCEKCRKSDWVDITNADGLSIIDMWAEFAGDAGLALSTADAAFIAGAREWVPALLSRVKELEEELRRAEVLAIDQQARLVGERERAENAARVEREACAKLVEWCMNHAVNAKWNEAGASIAAAIRARKP